MGGYGKQTRQTRPEYLYVQYTAPPYTKYGVVPVFHEEQETRSYRTVQAGSVLLDSAMDPYASILINTSDPDWNKSVDPVKSVIDGKPIVVGGNAINHPPHRDNGHPFNTRRRTINTNLKNVYFWNSNGRQVFSPCAIAAGATIAPAFQSKALFVFEGNSYAFGRLDKVPGQTDLANYGKKAIVYTAPGYPDVSVFAGLGELLADFPSFMGHNVVRAIAHTRLDPKGVVEAAQAGADEFLNYVFGTNPTVQDVAKVVTALRGATDSIILLSQNSGAGVRRNMTFDVPGRAVTFPSSELSAQGNVTALTSNSYYYSSGPSSNIEGLVGGTFSSSLYQSENRKVRFTGSFTRFIPVGADLIKSADRFSSVWDSVLGTKPSFERIWQLIPFSWLVDWFVDLQSTFALLDRVHDDSLLINYAYVSGSTLRTAVQETTVVPVVGRSNSFKFARSVATSSIKERIRANPYGFIAPDGVVLTPLRLAILAAVGITKRSTN